MAYLNLKCLLFLIFLTQSKCKVESCSPVMEAVSASPEGDVALPCFDSNTMGPQRSYKVKWTKNAANLSSHIVVLARPETPTLPDAPRVKWEADSNGHMSLFLTHLQVSDEGLYRCEVWHGWECVLVKEISLKLKDCRALQAVKTSPGIAVNLSCSVNLTSSQQTVQNASWAMLKGGKPVSLNAERVRVNGTLLTIQPVNVNDSGWYRCKYMLGKNQHCSDVNLLVQEEKAAEASTVPVITTKFIQASTTGIKRSENTETLTIAVVSVIVGFAVVVAVTVVCYYKYLKQRVTRQTRRNPGSKTPELVAYEVVSVLLSNDPTKRGDSGLYQDIQDEGLHTFQRPVSARGVFP